MPLLGSGFFRLLLKPTGLVKKSLAPQKALCQCSSKQMIVFLNPASVFTLSYSGLSPANDTGAKKKKKKQKKKKEKGSEADSAQDQPVKVTRRLCFLVTESHIFR